MMLPTGLFREAEHLLTTSKEKPAGMKPGLIASARSGAWLLAHPRVAFHRPHGSVALTSHRPDAPRGKA